MRISFILFVSLLLFDIDAQVTVDISNITANINNANIVIDYKIKNNSSEGSIISVPMDECFNNNNTTDSGLSVINNNTKTVIDPRFLFTETRNKMRIEPKEVIYKKVVLSKFYLLYYISHNRKPIEPKMVFQLFVHEYVSFQGKTKNIIESNKYEIDTKFWTAEEEKCIDLTKYEKYIFELFAFPDNLFFGYKDRNVQNINKILEICPSTLLAQWARYAFIKNEINENKDSIKIKGFIDQLEDLGRKTQDDELKARISSSKELFTKDTIVNRFYDSYAETPYKDKIQTFLLSDSYEKELESDDSKFIEIAQFLLRYVRRSEMNDWASYILELNKFLSKDEPRSREGRKALKRLKLRTEVEDLKRRIEKWVPKKNYVSIKK